MNFFTVSGIIRKVNPLARQADSFRFTFLVLERAWDPGNGYKNQWWNVTVFGSKAERLSTMLSTGKAVSVYGRIHQRVNERTQKLYHNVHAIEVEFISNREAQEMAQEKVPEEEQ